MRIFGSSFFINKFIENIKEEMSYEKLEVTKGLMEAYVGMYASQEEVVEDTVEQLNEAGNPGAAIAATQQRQRQAQAQGARQALQQGKTLGVAGNFGFQSGTTVKMDSAATRSQGRTVVTSNTPQNRGPRGGTSQARPNEINLGGQRMYAAQLGGKDVYVGARPTAKPPGANPPGQGSGGNPPRQGSGGNPPRQGSGGNPPAAPAAARTAPSGGTVLAKQGGVEGKLDKSTGKFTAGAFSSAEKTRYDARAPKLGPTGKPLVGGIERRTPTRSEMDKAAADRAASAGFKTPAGPTTGAAAFNKPAVQTPKPATPLSTTAGFQRPSTTPSGSSAFSQPTINVATKPDTGVQKPTAAIAAKPVQPAVAPTSTQMRQGTFREEVDAYDLVLEYLLANGHADTVDEAHYVMLEMDSEMIQNIIEVVTTTGEKAPKAVPSQMFPQAPRMGAERPFEKPFINPSGAPFRGASKPVKKDTKTA